MKKNYIISIDLGTTGNRVFCFDEKGLPIASKYAEFKQYFPKPGWVEHDPEEIWQSVVNLLKSVIDETGLNPSDAVSIGITNQRETTVIWNKNTGKPIFNAIVWQCRRTTDICDVLKEKGYENIILNKTGLVLDAYFSGTKIKWILDTVEGARNMAEQGKLLFGTIDTWILWKLTNGNSHKTDYTNASRTLIFNIIEKQWDNELLDMFGIPENILPEVAPSASDFGKTMNVPDFPNGVPICGIAGDQQAAMVGQNCINVGSIKNTYGTGCFMLLNIGNTYVISTHGLLTTLTCDDQGKPVYALEGSVFIGGAVIQWLRDYMNFFEDSTDTEKMALAANQDDSVVFIPAFVGLGAPYWDMNARGAIFGLTRDTSREQIIKAALQSIAFQSWDLIESMQQDSGKKIEELRVDGGATGNNYLMQFQADILGIPILLPEITESTALGAAYLAGISNNFYESIESIAKNNKIIQKFIPQMDEESRLAQRNKWHEAIKKLI